MVVQHNMQAANASRVLNITAGQQAKSTEKLSSGYKINRAADDAAGLSISEKMRKQIRGLTQASTNAQDGISAVQTAAGALNEVQDMLQRMNELAVKSANGTNSEDDRSYIQNEIDQLTTEIDRVAETTKFNETYLLKGDQDAVKDYTYKYAVKTGGVAAKAEMNKGTGNLTAAITFEATASGEDQNTVAKALRDQGISITQTINDDGTKATYSISLNGSAADKYNVVANGDKFEIQDKKGTKIAEIATPTGGNEVNAANKNKVLTETITAKSIEAGVGAGEKAKYYDRDGNGIPENALNNYFSAVPGAGGAAPTVGAKAAANAVYDAVGNKVALDKNNVNATQDLTGALSLTLHVGADATTNNQISVNLDAMSAKGLGVNGLKVDGTDDSNALSAIDTIKEAIQKVSTQRSALGAVQNRLEHTISNLDNVVENTTSAESQIRDTDMASEMVKYSNNNILSQAGQAMLAQANQSNQGVLSLLQ